MYSFYSKKKVRYSDVRGKSIKNSTSLFAKKMFIFMKIIFFIKKIG